MRDWSRMDLVCKSKLYAYLKRLIAFKRNLWWLWICQSLTTALQKKIYIEKSITRTSVFDQDRSWTMKKKDDRTLWKLLQERSVPISQQWNYMLQISRPFGSFYTWAPLLHSWWQCVMRMHRLPQSECK